LMQNWLALMATDQVDYTICWRKFSETRIEDDTYPAKSLFSSSALFDAWFSRYRSRLEKQVMTDAERGKQMKQANPKYILRNYLAQQAIEKAHQQDFSEVNRLLQLLYKPYDEQPELERYAAAPPAWGKHLEISCSS
jgi:uncharacterized protein YdiU (UPF0061 family)